jgi:hypothetical protein
VRNHIAPFLGQLKVGQLDAEALDAFYAELRRCRKHCAGRRMTDHRTVSPHECDHRLAAPMQAAQPDDRPAHALHPVWRLQARGALAVGVGEPDRSGRAAGSAEAEPRAADACRGPRR